MRHHFVLSWIIFLPLLAAAQGQRINLDADWKFHGGDEQGAKDTGYDDSKWRALDLPHDWSIEGAFDQKNSTGQGEGGLPAGVCWYRKHFLMPSGGAGGIISVDFDGVYRNCEIWINGHYLGKRPNGYISFRYELTPWLRPHGENMLAVRVDNAQQPNSRWYSGTGIYRHVWLVNTGRIALGHWGVFATTPEVDAHKARLHVQTTIRNTLPGARDVRLETTVLNRDGRIEVTNVRQLSLKDSLNITDQDLTISSPQCWSPDHPYLYTVRTRLIYKGQKQDESFTYTGLRRFQFDIQKGFILNGAPLKIKGVCLHHDLGALGAAVNKSAIIRQLRLLKEMGCNAIRTSHNPPAPELLDACDSMGFLVMDEAFDMWRKKKTKYDYSLDFPAWHTRDLEDQVRRDRNHPSVIIWSIGNEIREQFDSTGISLARELAGIIRSLDTTRPVTSALTETDTAKNFIYRSGALDLVGLNYHHEQYDSALQHYPGHPIIATETMSALETRGHYDMPSDSIRRWRSAEKAKAPLVGANADWTASAYDNVSAYWGSTHEETWKVVKRDPFVSGLFIWTGFDYIGEPTPYPWPARSSYFGIIDLAGFPKDVYYMYQSEWTVKPILHIFPHWNWTPGKLVDVWAYYSQADEVELFLNGRSLGVRRKQGDDLHVMWRVPFKPGLLHAVSRKNGRVVLEQEIRTAGPAVHIELTADRKMLRADGEDLAFITVRITDAKGQLVPDATPLLHFKVEGAATLAGADNGYEADLGSFRGADHRAYNGLCLGIIRPGREEGKIVVTVSGQGLLPCHLYLHALKLLSAGGDKHVH